VVDALFAHPRLAAVYDAFDGERDDLDAYVALADELGARSVLDVGCGTGNLACLLAARGVDVVGLDPAGASLDVARRKPGADRVRWVHGDATALGGPDGTGPDGAGPAGVGPVDLVTMTGNVAQVFVTDAAWAATLAAARAALRSGGTLVFEARDPAREAWRGWDRARSFRRAHVPGVGHVASWIDLTEARPPLVSFRTTFEFAADGATLTSDSTLRFRSRAEVAASLAAAGLTLDEVRDAPDRPGAEMVFLARR